MFTIFPLVQFKEVSLKEIFQKFHDGVHYKKKDRNRYRIIEEELNHIEHARRVICLNPRLKMDMGYLVGLENSYLVYITWLEKCSKALKFSQQSITNLNAKFEIYNTWSAEVNSYTDSETELYYLKFNLALIHYAKGVIAMQINNEGKPVINTHGFFKCRTIINQLQHSLKVDTNIPNKVKDNQKYLSEMCVLFDLMSRYLMKVKKKQVDVDASSELNKTLSNANLAFKEGPKCFRRTFELIQKWSYYLMCYCSFRVSSNKSKVSILNEVCKIIHDGYNRIPDPEELDTIEINSANLKLAEAEIGEHLKYTDPHKSESSIEPWATQAEPERDIFHRIFPTRIENFKNREFEMKFLSCIEKVRR